MREERIRKLCRENMVDIANAQLKFRAASPQHNYAQLGDLWPYLNPIPRCLDGGDYFFKFWWTNNPKPEFSERVPELRLTVHCHNKNHGKYASGVDDDERIPDYNREFRRICKENMRELLRAQEIYKVRSQHNVYTVRLDDLRPILNELPKCPVDGGYSFTIGIGNRIGPVDAVLPNGTVVVWCSAYGHRGGTLDKRAKEWLLGD